MPYKNKEYQKEYRKKYYQNNKEYIREYSKKYYQKNIEREKERSKAYWQNTKRHIKGKYKEYNKKWNQKNKEYRKQCHYKRTYNLTLEEIDQMLEKQDHKCPICGKSLIETRRCVDHDHVTNKNRGILCSRCNTGLACIEDAIFSEKAKEYLNKEK